MAKKKAKPTRIVVSISISSSLVKKIDTLAAKENRTRSNFIEQVLQTLIK